MSSDESRCPECGSERLPHSLRPIVCFNPFHDRPVADAEAERKAFEKSIGEVRWWTDNFDRKPDGRYASERTEERWQGWLARSKR